MTYTLDTNILINLARRYPRDIFASIWDEIEGAAARGEICVCQVVLTELGRGSDELCEWAKGIPEFVCSPLQEEMEVAKQISLAHPGWVREEKNYADPFIIAHAKCEMRTLVTEEVRRGPGAKNKNLGIPNIAEENGITTINFLDFVRENDWHF